MFKSVLNFSSEIEFITIYVYVIYIVVLSQNMGVSKGITYMMYYPQSPTPTLYIGMLYICNIRTYCFMNIRVYIYLGNYEVSNDIMKQLNNLNM